MTNQKPLRMVMIGGGSMAGEHIKAFADVPGVSVAGIWNRTRDKAEALAKTHAIPFVADSIDALYAKTKADIAVVAVYEPAINSVVKQALTQPWTVLMEKPVGLDFADAQDIAAAAKGCQAGVYVGLNRRSMSSTRAALDDLKDDPSPRYIHVQDQQSLQVARDIGHTDAVVRTWMYANSIHLVDYLRAFGRGEIAEVLPVMRWNAEKPGVVLAKVTFSSGDVGIYEGIWHGPGPWGCVVTTPRRRWELRPLEKASYQNAGERKVTPVDVDAWDQSFKPGFRMQAERVVAAVRGEPGAVTLEDALQTMRLIQDIFQT